MLALHLYKHDKMCCASARSGCATAAPLNATKPENSILKMRAASFNAILTWLHVPGVVVHHKLTHHMLYTCPPALDPMPQATAAPLSANEAGKLDFENARREFNAILTWLHVPGVVRCHVETLTTVKWPKNFGTISRFVRVILAQGPC